VRGAGAPLGREAAGACDRVPDVGVVPVSARRLRGGRGEGDRVAGPVRLLGRGLDRADRIGGDPGPQAAGPRRVPRAVRTDLRPGRRGHLGHRGAARPRHRAGVVPARLAAAGHRRVRGRRPRHPRQRRGVRLRRVRTEPVGVPQGAGRRAGRVRHPRLRRRTARRVLDRGEDAGPTAGPTALPAAAPRRAAHRRPRVLLLAGVGTPPPRPAQRCCGGPRPS
jgi:hypothetical protein